MSGSEVGVRRQLPGANSESMYRSYPRSGVVPTSPDFSAACPRRDKLGRLPVTALEGEHRGADVGPRLTWGRRRRAREGRVIHSRPSGMELRRNQCQASRRRGAARVRSGLRMAVSRPGGIGPPSFQAELQGGPDGPRRASRRLSRGRRASARGGRGNAPPRSRRATSRSTGTDSSRRYRRAPSAATLTDTSDFCASTAVIRRGSMSLRQIPATASSEKDPAKRESCTSTARSESLSRLTLQSMTDARLRWRGRALRDSPRSWPRSTDASSSARSSTSASDATSSMPSGRPSIRAQMRLMTGMSLTEGSKPGRTSRTRSVKSATASSMARSSHGWMATTRSPGRCRASRLVTTIARPGQRRESR